MRDRLLAGQQHLGQRHVLSSVVLAAVAPPSVCIATRPFVTAGSSNEMQQRPWSQEGSAAQWQRHVLWHAEPAALILLQAACLSHW